MAPLMSVGGVLLQEKSLSTQGGINCLPGFISLDCIYTYDIIPIIRLKDSKILRLEDSKITLFVIFQSLNLLIFKSSL